MIGANVEIGDGTTIGPHVVINGTTRIGRDNRIFQFASIGADPQDKKYGGEKSELVIGDRNVIREFATLNRGTGEGGGATRIGDDNWIMAYVHVAHDCVVGQSHDLLEQRDARGTRDDRRLRDPFGASRAYTSSAASARTRSSAWAVSSTGDVPPFVVMAADYGRPRGINAEGLKRRGFDADRIAAIKRAYRTLYLGKLPLAEARTELAAMAADSKDVAVMLDFIEASDRALVR